MFTGVCTEGRKHSHLNSILIAAGIGIGGAAAFVFLLPESLLAGLAQQHLRLPGTSAVSAGVLGPWAIFLMLNAVLVTKRHLTALVTAVAMSSAVGFLGALGYEVLSEATLGHPMALGGVTVAALVFELGWILVSIRHSWIFSLLFSTVGSVAFTAFSSTSVLRHTMSDFDWRNVPLELTLAFAGGVAAALAALVAHHAVGMVFEKMD